MKAHPTSAIFRQGFAYLFAAALLLFVQAVPALANATLLPALLPGDSIRLATDSSIYQPLPFNQDWSDTSLLSRANDWSTVPGIVGHLGSEGIYFLDTDPQTLLTDYPGDITIVVNKGTPGTYSTGGLAEFDGLEDPVVAFLGSSSADHPFLELYLDTRGYYDVQVSYNLRDIDSTNDNAAQQVALHYRVGTEGDFTNVPEGYVNDASSGPGKADKVTPMNVTLPPAASDQPYLHLRIMTSDANSSDEWIGVDDISVTGTPISEDLPPTVSSVTPLEGSIALPVDSTLSVVFSEAVSVTEGWFSIECGTTGSHPAQVSPAAGSAAEFTLSPLSPFDPYESCLVTLHANQISDTDWIADPLAADYSWSFLTYDPDACASPFTPIYSIQGNGPSSPLSGMVYTEGVVTGDFQSGMDGYFIQDPAGDGDPLTSDGLFVYDTLSDSMTEVQVGDHVRVYGTVREYRGMTELSEPTQVTICKSGETIQPLALTLPPAVDLEPYEGMYVTIETPLTVSQNYYLGYYGQLTLSAGGRLFQPLNDNGPGEDLSANLKRMLILDDGSSLYYPDPIPYLGADSTVRAGDQVNSLTGVIDHGAVSSGADPAIHYRLHPTVPPTFVRNNPRPVPPESTGPSLKIASFNVLNYFTTLKVRGADTELELTRQRDKLVAALVPMDADIVGLVEVENSETNAAINDLISGLNSSLGSPVYDPILDSAPAPSAGGNAIEVGLIYNRTTVKPLGQAMSYQVENDPVYGLLYDRPPLVQTFEDLATGQRFTVIVNHFKSKSCEGATGADLDQGDGQGCWNAKRSAQAEKLLELIETVRETTPQVLVIGDLNAYGAETPIQNLTSGGLVNEIQAHVPAESRYSYVFDGMSGYLDHALATLEMHAWISGTSIWHINADEPAAIDYNLENRDPTDLYSKTPYRSADHDPVLVELSLPMGDLDTEFKLNPDRDVAPGATVTYTMTMQNTGEGMLYDLSLTDPLPDELVFDRFITASGATFKERTVSWKGDLAPSESVTISFTVTYLPEGWASERVVTNTIQISTRFSEPGSVPLEFITRKYYRMFVPMLDR